MLAFFRRAFRSRVVLIVLGLVALAIVVTGVGTPNGLGLGGVGGGGADGDVVARVGDIRIHAADVSRRAQAAVDAARQQQPNATMADLVAQGGIESIVDQLVGGRALELWARRHGFVASSKLVDGEIASIPAFFGPSGKFDDTTFRQALVQAHVTEAQLRDDIAGDAVRKMLVGPIVVGTRAPLGVVTPYASMLLEKRQGFVALVPGEAMPAGAAPTDAEAAAWYARHVAAYTLPERRVLRYALVTPDQAKVPAPTDAEIADDYRAHTADYAAKELRTIAQLTLPGEAAAKAAAAKIAGGASFASVAQEAGFSAQDTAIGALDRTALAARSGAAVTDAAFALKQGGVSAPVRSTLGWAIVRVDAIRTTPLRTLADERATIAAKLAAQKRDAAYADLLGAVQDQLDKGATFDEVARAKALTSAQTPPVTATGAAPGVAGWAPPPFLAGVLKAAFDAAPDDAPSIEQLGKAGALLLKVGQVLPAAPVPLAQVKADVARDILADRRLAAARVAAEAIAARIGKGDSLAAAIGASGLKLPSPQPIGARQADIARGDAPVPPALAMLFQMRRGTARIAPVPGGRGWFIVVLDTIERGDATNQPALVQLTARDFTRLLGDEYMQQFARAVEQELGASRDTTAIGRLKEALRTGRAPR